MLSYDDAAHTLTVAPEGELDHFMAQNMRASIDEMIVKTGARTLTFDMKHISFMDSSGIGMIIGRYKLMKRRAGRVTIRSMNASLERIFKLSGLAQIIKFENSESTGAGGAVKQKVWERKGNK